MSECTALLNQSFGYRGFQTLASAHALHLPMNSVLVFQIQKLEVQKFIHAQSSLNRDESMLAQLRTGHLPLQKHLHRIGHMSSLTCLAC